MELKEIEMNISEIEVRLDRLRALYDQYFMGFEKLEPSVQRKDVDRRFMILRKENFRNTALRFRLNVALQKYSTYQTYWQRICRQIEEGTYKRHVQKAKARFAADAARKRGDADFEIDVDVDLAELDSMSDEDFLAQLHEPDMGVGRGPARGNGLIDEEDDGIDTVRPPPGPNTDGPGGRTDAPASSEQWWEADPLAAIMKPPSLREPATRSPQSLRSPRVPSLFGEDAPHTQPGFNPPDSYPQSLSPDTQPQPFRPMSLSDAERRASRRDLRDSPPATDPAPAPVPESYHPPPMPKGPAVRRVGIEPPRRDSAQAMVSPAPSSPVARPLPVGKPDIPKARPGELTEDRIRQIYAQYVREKRMRGESTATTTFESVARSLRTSSEKLRGQHGGKDVDFEVAEKDGRTILRPIVK